MRFILFFIFLFTTLCSVTAQDSLVTVINENVEAITDTSTIAADSSASTDWEKTNAIYNQHEFLTNASNEQNDRKKKALVRIGIGVVFLVVVIAGWRRRRLAK